MLKLTMGRNAIRAWTAVATLSALVILGATWHGLSHVGPRSIAGMWNVRIDSRFASGDASFSITQSGRSISGEYKSKRIGTADVRGSLRGDLVDLSVHSPRLLITFAGKVVAENEMRGTLVFDGIDEGTFVAHRLISP